MGTFGLYPLETVELRYFAGYIGYMLLGWYLSNKDFGNLNKRILMLIGMIIFALSTGLAVFCLANSIDFPKYYLSIVPVLQVTGLYLFIKSFAVYGEKSNALTGRIYSFIKNSVLGKIIFSISICSFGIYLTHYFPIWVFKIYNPVFHFFSRNPVKWIPFIFLVSLLFSWGLIWAMSKVPFLKKFSGT